MDGNVHVVHFDQYLVHHGIHCPGLISCLAVQRGNGDGLCVIETVSVAIVNTDNRFVGVTATLRVDERGDLVVLYTLTSTVLGLAALDTWYAIVPCSALGAMLALGSRLSLVHAIFDAVGVVQGVREGGVLLFMVRGGIIVALCRVMATT